MRNLVSIFVFLLCFHNSVIGQGPAFLVEGKWWLNQQFFQGLPILDPWYWMLGEDTLINNTLYTPVIIPDNQCEGFDIGLYLREDTINSHRIWALDLRPFSPCVDSLQEFLLMDFSLGVGDTIDNCFWQISGATRVINIQSGAFTSVVLETYIDGNWYFFSINESDVMLGDLIAPLRGGLNFSQMSGIRTLSFGTSIDTDCDFVSVDRISTPKDISIHPNPTDGLLYLHFHAEPERVQELRLRIVNSLGQEMRLWTEGFHDMQYVIEMDEYPPGMYYLVVENERGELLKAEKIIKN